MTTITSGTSANSIANENERIYSVHLQFRSRGDERHLALACSPDDALQRVRSRYPEATGFAVEPATRWLGSLQTKAAVVGDNVGSLPIEADQGAGSKVFGVQVNAGGASYSVLVLADNATEAEQLARAMFVSAIDAEVQESPIDFFVDGPVVDVLDGRPRNLPDSLKQIMSDWTSPAQ